MNYCQRCNKKLTENEEKIHLKKAFCEDCYLELFLEKTRKASYQECDHSFMLRLKPGFDNRRLFTGKEDKK